MGTTVPLAPDTRPGRRSWPWRAVGVASAVLLTLIVAICLWTPWGGSIPIGGTDLLAQKGMPRGAKITQIEYTPDGGVTAALKFGRTPEAAGHLAETYVLAVPDDSRLIRSIVRIVRHARKAWPRPLLADGATIRLQAEDGTAVDVFFGWVREWNAVYLEGSTYVSKPLARVLTRIEEEKRGHCRKQWSLPGQTGEDG